MNYGELRAGALRLCVYHRAYGIETTTREAEVLILRELETGGEEAVRALLARQRKAALAGETVLARANMNFSESVYIFVRNLKIHFCRY